jgi:hypothetical protein
MTFKSILFSLTVTALAVTVQVNAASAVGPGGACAGVSGAACDAGLWCELAAGVCGRADAQGQCRSAPHSCRMAGRPVCGCDGRTYANDCERMRARAQKARGGPCAGETGSHRHRREKDATDGQT